ncbi:MAG TPA: hypothetical protein VFL53_07000 [Pseudolabrys sp.]|nr:hypothetical protein [Pseudolabrys sp.]
MPMRDRARWAFAVVFSMALLSAPAIWNRFPLLQYDTGGYLARWYEPYLVPSRAVAYGLILNAGAALSFWPVVLGQSALTAWVIALILRVHGLGGRPGLLAGIVATLSIFSTLPWLTAILLTDIFAGLAVLALYLLLFRADELTRREQIGLVVLVAVSVATHSATFAVLLMLLAGAVLVSFIAPDRLPRRRFGNGALAIALGALLVFGANAAVTRQLTWTPGGFALSFGRMLQDGIVKKYLDEHCPKARLVLCAYKDELPRDADEWFWGSPLFDKLGRFAGLDHEMEQIALASVAEYPLLQIKTAAIATARQLIDVRTGEGVVNSIWHTYGIVERYRPGLVAEMRAARQQRGEIDFTMINRVHYPVALACLLLLPLIGGYMLRRPETREIGELATVCLFALLANAFICGTLSNPHDRYGARLIWLAVAVTAIAAVRLYEERRRLRAAALAPSPP